jgi:hypothetical protein
MLVRMHTTFPLHYLVHANLVPKRFCLFVCLFVCNKISNFLGIETSITGFHPGGSLGIIQFRKNA